MKRRTNLYVLSIHLSDSRIAATMFSIIMALANVGTGIGLGVTGFLTDEIGFQISFLVLAGLNMLALPLIRKIFF